MRPGQLRHRIEIQRHTIVGYDPANMPIMDWGTLAEVWGAVEPVSGKEYWARVQVQAETTHKITLRWPGFEIKPTDRILFEDRILEIEAVLNLEERNQWVELMCKEKLS